MQRFMPCYNQAMDGTRLDSKKKAVLDRIKHLEEAIVKGSEYLENGQHADWSGFRPLFAAKFRNGEESPPHRDWVKNVFRPRVEAALSRAERVLDEFDGTKPRSVPSAIFEEARTTASITFTQEASCP